MSPEEVGSGIVTGGWEYVYAAYAVSWIALIGYTVSLWLRWPQAEGEP